MEGLTTRVTLISRILNQQDDEAWKEFIDYYKSYLTAVIRRYGLTPEDTEDVLQNTLIKIWEIIPNFNYDNFKG